MDSEGVIEQLADTAVQRAEVSRSKGLGG